MKMLINDKKLHSTKSSLRSHDDVSKNARITTASSFFLNPPKSSKTNDAKKEDESVTSLVGDVISQATRNMQSSGSSINLNNQMMSNSLSSSSGLVEGSSRSSSSIDTGSNTNTDELLNAGTDLIVNNSDLSGSSRRSSINDIGMDVELDQNGEYSYDQKSVKNDANLESGMIANMYIKNDTSNDVVDDYKTFSKNAPSNNDNKTDQFKNSKLGNKQRQNNYFNRCRRSRIVKTPPIEWNKMEDDEDSEKISDQLDSPKSEKISVNEDLYDFYLKNRNHAQEKKEDDELFVKSNYKNIESLKLKFDSPQKSKLDKLDNYLERSKPIISNWLNNSNSALQPSHLMNHISTAYNDTEDRTRKSLDFNTSDSDLNDSISQKKNFYQKNQQQTDKPVFKYLSKNLINNLFVKDEHAATKSKSSSKLVSEDQAKLEKDCMSKSINLNSSQEKLYPSSINYNYLINKYSPVSRSESNPTKMYYTNQNKIDTTNKINSSIVNIIKDLVSDAIDTSTTEKPTLLDSSINRKLYSNDTNNERTNYEHRRSGKSHSDELEVAVTVELESDDDVLDDNSSLTYPKLTINTNNQSHTRESRDQLFLTDDDTNKNTERNRSHISPIDYIRSDMNSSDSSKSTKPLIKTLINDITKLKNDTYLSSCLDYLNQNFNKTLDDLVELEDNKKTTLNTAAITTITTTDQIHEQVSEQELTNANNRNNLIPMKTKDNVINSDFEKISTNKSIRASSLILGSIDSGSQSRMHDISYEMNLSNDSTQLINNNFNMNLSLNYDKSEQQNEDNANIIVDAKKLQLNNDDYLNIINDFTTNNDHQMKLDSSSLNTNEIMNKNDEDNSDGGKSNFHRYDCENEKNNNKGESLSNKKLAEVKTQKIETEVVIEEIENTNKNTIIKSNICNDEDELKSDLSDQIKITILGNVNSINEKNITYISKLKENTRKLETCNNNRRNKIMHNNNNNNINTQPNNTKKNNDPIDLNYLNNYAKLYVENIENLKVKESSQYSSSSLTNSIEKERKDNFNEIYNNECISAQAKNLEKTENTNPESDNQNYICKQVTILTNSDEVNMQKYYTNDLPQVLLNPSSDILLNNTNQTSTLTENMKAINGSLFKNKEKIEHEIADLTDGDYLDNDGSNFNEEFISDSIVSDVLGSEHDVLGTEHNQVQGTEKVEVEESGINKENVNRSIESEINMNVNEAIDSLINQIDSLESSLSNYNEIDIYGEPKEKLIKPEFKSVSPKVVVEVEEANEKNEKNSCKLESASMEDDKTDQNTVILVIEKQAQNEAEEKEKIVNNQNSEYLLLSKSQVLTNMEISNNDVENKTTKYNKKVIETNSSILSKQELVVDKEDPNTNFCNLNEEKLDSEWVVVQDKDYLSLLKNSNNISNEDNPKQKRNKDDLNLSTNTSNNLNCTETLKEEQTKSIMSDDNHFDKANTTYCIQKDGDDDDEKIELKEKEVVKDSSIIKQTTESSDNHTNDISTNNIKVSTSEETLTPCVSITNSFQTTVNSQVGEKKERPEEKNEYNAEEKVLDNKCEILDESGDLSINKLSTIEKDIIDKNTDEKFSTTTLDDSISSTYSTNKDQEDSLMISSDLDATPSSSAIKKIVLKNKEIVLVETCSDDDEEDLKRIIMKKNKSPTSEELFPVLVAQERKARRSKQTIVSQVPPLDFSVADFKSSKFVTSSTSSYLNSSRKTDTNSSNDEDDPFVKAALERFDAFCKSKSTQNIDQAGVTVKTPSQSPSFSSRQKSPFLTRRVINQPNEETKLKESIGSFIKRRQARIDPNLLSKHPSSTLNGSDSEAKSVKVPMISRSVSETRGPIIDNLFSSSLRANPELKQQSLFNESLTDDPTTSTALASSNIAKKFLGSLTPQLEPMNIENEIKSPTRIDQRIQDNKEADNQDKSPETPRRRAILQNKKSDSTNSIHNINRTSSAPSTMPLNLRAKLTNENTENYEPTASTSSTSSIDEVKTPRSKAVNVIKLEVVNSKKDCKISAPEKTMNNSKPPLPPVSTLTHNPPSQPTPPWRSKTPATEISQETQSAKSTSKIEAVTSKPPSPKPGVRMIPLEVKNTKSRMIPLEVKANGSTISRSNSKSDKILNSSFANVTPPVPLKTVEKSGFLSAKTSPEKEITSPSTEIANRPRSVSSFRIERESATGGLRNSSSFSYRDLAPLNSNLSTSYSGNLNVNNDSDMLPIKTDGRNPDPIIEKACSNFMFKLMEFQRHQKPYSPLDKEYKTLEITNVTANSPNTISSPSSSNSNLYSGPIVSARTSTLPEYASRFTDTSPLPAPDSPVVSSTLQKPSTQYTSPYMSNYSTNNYNFPSTSLSRSTHGITENIYKTDFTKFSSDLGSLDSARPYVSAIRKRRTLFEDLQSGTGNQEALTNQYLIPQNYTTSQNTDSNEQYVVNRQQRPLSIVSEEAGYHPLTRSLSAKGDSRSFVDIQKISNIPDAANNSNSSKINRPPLKKSHSTASPQKSPVPSTNQQCDSSSNDAIPHTTVSAPQPKLRSTVFDRLAALNNNNTNSPKLSSQKSNSNLNLNLETPEITMKKSAKNIKDQNEIAIVTNMTPSTSKKDLSHYSSTNSTATLSRIRSLDSKSRDKLKNKDFLKKSQSSLTSNKMASSQKNLSETSKKLKSASSQLPPAAPTSSSHSNSTSPTPNNFNSNSNPSFKIDNSITSSNQTPATNSSTSTSAARSDVFERLSKRTNSMKNLSNNSINNA